MNLSHPAVLLLVLLAACTPARWEKEGATQASIQADGEECWEKARTQARTSRSPAPDGVVVGGPADGARDRAMDETGIYQRCMRDKGYTSSK